MKLLARIKAVVREWLGIPDLGTKALIQAREKADRERHAELLAVLNRIEQRLTIEYAKPPQQTYTPPILDWDTVMAIQLHNLEKGEEQ